MDNRKGNNVILSLGISYLLIGIIYKALNMIVPDSIIVTIAYVSFIISLSELFKKLTKCTIKIGNSTVEFAKKINREFTNDEIQKLINKIEKRISRSKILLNLFEILEYTCMFFVIIFVPLKNISEDLLNIANIMSIISFALIFITIYAEDSVDFYTKIAERKISKYESDINKAKAKLKKSKKVKED